MIMDNPYLSIVVPVFNEEDALPQLIPSLYEVLNATGHAFEVIIVNDGSGDNSISVLRQLSEQYSSLRVVDFRRNYGQTAAIMAGIQYASGEILISIDADLQNDPKDIPRLLNKIDEGFDLVSGWRKQRKDSPVKRTLLSKIANFIISKISGVHLHDYGCTLKAYRRALIKDIKLYGEMHRFIPIYAKWMGARITEIPVNHHPREFGVSKYGMERIVKVTLDLLVVKFLDRHFAKPIYVFGGFGLLSIFFSFVSGGYMLYLKGLGHSMILTPLPVLTAFLLMIGIMSILMGLIAEMLVRTYFESQDRASYGIRELINFEPPQ